MSSGLRAGQVLGLEPRMLANEAQSGATGSKGHGHGLRLRPGPEGTRC